MKKITKLFITCLLAFLMVFSTAFTVLAAEDTNASEYDIASIEENFVYPVFDVLLGASKEELEYNYQICSSQGYRYADMFLQWEDYCDKVGDLQKFENTEYTVGEDLEIVITTTAVFTNASVNTKIVYSFLFNDFQSIKFSLKESGTGTIGEKMAEAGGNLVVGMGTVFLVLIFLCGVIYLFRYIGKAEKALADKKAAKNASPAKTETSTPVVTEIVPAPVSNDELQAVIAAAVAAYESDNGSEITKQPSLTNGINIKTYRRN